MNEVVILDRIDYADYIPLREYVKVVSLNPILEFDLLRTDVSLEWVPEFRKDRSLKLGEYEEVLRRKDLYVRKKDIPKEIRRVFEERDLL